MENNKKKFISTSEESVNMFHNNIIEALSKTYWFVPILVYIPIIIFFNYLSIKNNLSFYWVLLAIPTGLFVWSLTEYILHRYIFHYMPKTEIGQRLHWLFHGVHHDYPQDKNRLVMPPGVSLPIATIFFLLFEIFLSKPFMYSFFSFFLLGYLYYDISHFAYHHFIFKNKYFEKLKKHHMKHHYKDDEQGFGVSSQFWDFVFKTKKM